MPSRQAPSKHLAAHKPEEANAVLAAPSVLSPQPLSNHKFEATIAQNSFSHASSPLPKSKVNNQAAHVRPPLPAGLVTALPSLLATYRKDRFGGVMSLRPTRKELYEPRIRCHDCPDQLYVASPKWASSFEAHLQSRCHRQRVEARIAREAMPSLRPTNNQMSEAMGLAAHELSSHVSAPLSFTEMGEKYFHCAGLDSLDFNTAIAKRSEWLNRLDLCDHRYHRLCRTLEEQAAVENLYGLKPAAERKILEERARYLKAMVDQGG